MSGPANPPARSAMERTRARRTNPWDGGALLLSLATAVALWVFVLAGVTAPLGDAQARLERRTAAGERPACATPADALASASLARTRAAAGEEPAPAPLRDPCSVSARTPPPPPPPVRTARGR